MRVESVKNNSYNEIIVVNRKNSFKSNKIVPKYISKHLNLDMTTKVGYNGEPTYKPAPISVGDKLFKFLNDMKVDWNTHIDPNKSIKNF